MQRLFSVIILVVPQAMGMEVQMNEGKGPLLPVTIQCMEDVNQLRVEEAHFNLQYVYEAIRLTKRQLDGRVPLIGFAGAPWTLFCYMIEGRGSRTFDQAKAFCYQYPAIAHALLQNITTVTINYLQQQIQSGADCVQLFDSWAGVWDKQDFSVYCLPYIRQIVDAVKESAPVIVYAKGAWHSLQELQQTGAAALGLDWCNTPEFARQSTGHAITLQGNYDPVKLLQPVHKIKEDVSGMIASFGAQKYIVNLGHGILPHIPVEHARAFVEAVKEWKI